MLDQDCLFCKIIRGQIPAKKVYEDDDLFAFEDINPQAPVHILIIPKQHIPSMQDIEQEHEAILGKLFHQASKLAKKLNLDAGYRLVTNCMADAGQEVFHLHIHLLGGRKFTWPPG